MAGAADVVPGVPWFHVHKATGRDLPNGVGSRTHAGGVSAAELDSRGECVAECSVNVPRMFPKCCLECSLDSTGECDKLVLCC
jgi:hypothetical protein